MEHLDYSEVPAYFAHCAADCPQASACLRRLAYDELPADKSFVLMVVPRLLTPSAGACKFFLSSERARYARGFIKMASTLQMARAKDFRDRLIASLGRKKYYKARKGEYVLTPKEQQQVLSLLRSMGANTDIGFDGYTYRHVWQ